MYGICCRQNRTPEHDKDQAPPRETSIALKRAEACGTIYRQIREVGGGFRSEKAIDQIKKICASPCPPAFVCTGGLHANRDGVACMDKRYFPLPYLHAIYSVRRDGMA
jgi:hypothetical protein